MRIAKFLEAMNLAVSAHLDELVDCFATSYKTALTIGSGRDFANQNKDNNTILVLFKDPLSSAN